jgi:hypothetical protein
MDINFYTGATAVFHAARGTPIVAGSCASGGGTKRRPGVAGLGKGAAFNSWIKIDFYTGVPAIFHVAQICN